MKKRAIIVLCLALVLTLIGCGNNAQSSDIMYKSDFGVTIRKAMIKRKHSLMRMLMLPEKSILWIVQL